MADQAHHGTALPRGAAPPRREALAQAHVGLEDALSTPLGDCRRWRLRVAMAADHAVNRIDEHIWQAEGPEGVLADIVDSEPRLGREVARLRDDHNQLQKKAYELRGILAELADGEVSAQGDAVRNQALELLGHLSAHSERDADLVYEAFLVDLGTAH